MPKKRTAYDGIRTYTEKERNMYLMGLLGQNIVYNVMVGGIEYYLGSVIFMPAMAIGVIMTIAQIWDAFNDPIMGTLVDKTRSKWGKCRPYLLIIPIPVMVVTTLCFTNFGFYTDPNANKYLILFWALFVYLIWDLVYTIGDIPLWGITALMTENSEHRNQLLSRARLFASVGAIAMVGMQPISIAVGKMLESSVFAHLDFELAVNQGRRYGFLLTAFILSLIGCGLFQLTGIFSKERVKASEKSNSIGENFKLMWNNKPFRQILISGILESPKSVVVTVALMLVSFYYGNNDSAQMVKYYVTIGSGLFIGMFLGMSIINPLLKKYEKRVLYTTFNLASVLPFTLIFVFYMTAKNHDVTTPIYIVLYAVMFAFAGVSIGTTMVLRSQMIADCVDYEEYQSGLRPDGVFFAGQSFLVKLSAGIATIISSVSYWAVHFEKEAREAVILYAETGGVIRENPEYHPYMMILFFLVSIPPAVGCLLTALSMIRYALTDKEHKRILGELNERRHAGEENAVEVEA
ncbi:MAG: MFS transporter [Oscillospiraceae bacterium]|nr:MFS transporter [Oscillospiraceae bacterium]